MKLCFAVLLLMLAGFSVKSAPTSDYKAKLTNSGAKLLTVTDTMINRDKGESSVEDVEAIQEQKVKVALLMLQLNLVAEQNQIEQTQQSLIDEMQKLFVLLFRLNSDTLDSLRNMTFY